jgi:hypothetical protein
MNSRPFTPATAIALLLALLGYASPSLAYLDPGTGSMIVSAIVGLIATVTLAAKTWWYRIRRFFRRAEPETTAPRAADEDETPSGPGTP